MATTPRTVDVTVDNGIYARLGDRWYTASDDPVALLRAEARARNPWIADVLARTFDGRSCRVLDIGCGAGFLANDLARRGHELTALDAAEEALVVAAAHDDTRRVRWARGDATRLPFADASFEAACAMDLLEHVEDWSRVVAEAARVLAPGGLFFFHTFDRNALAWLVVIKGVEWFVRNTPRDMHVLRMFVRPRELEEACAKSGLVVQQMRGLAPDARRASFWRMLATGVVPDDFAFRFTRSLRLGYCGFCRLCDQ